MSPISIFYARSSHRETTTLVFNSIYEYFLRNKDLNADVLDVDNSIENSSIFLECITKNLDKADLMICDITPDFTPNEHLNKREIEITPCVNANVMFELGYFARKHQFKDIILIIKKDYPLPSMLRGSYFLRYEDDTDIEMIIDRVVDFGKQINRSV
jgi:predicted nucleotide-binding protein